MKRLGIIFGMSILGTAVLSTVLSFILFQHFSTQQGTPQAEVLPSQLVNYKPTNAKPITFPGDFVSTANKVTPAIVNVGASSGAFSGSNGSGVIVSPNGYIITNYHVISNATRYNITLNNKKEYPARLIGTDPTTDLALLKINATNLPTVAFGNSDEVQVGEWVVAVGNPFNLASTVTAGIVSAKARNINILGEQEYSVESFIQTDAVVNPGNSGGALVNANGELVGINSAILTETGSYEGYSFAIPANLVKKVIEDLRDYGEIKRAVLGVRILDIDSDRARLLGLDDVSGVEIKAIFPNTSASAAGLREGDVILKVNNQSVDSTPELQEQVARYRPGDTISIDFIRDGKRLRKERVRLQELASVDD